MRNRQLLRTKTACVSVAGLVSISANEEIEQILNSAHSGGIDSSGLAFIVADNNIRIWKQDVYSLSEEILQDQSPIVELTHASDTQIDIDFENSITRDHAGTRYDSAKRVVLAPSNSGTSYANSQRRNEIIHSGISLYWASLNGSICYWDDISESGRDYDLSISLPLEEGEFVTCVTRHDAAVAVIAGSILVGTSKKRTFFVWKTARPMELHSKLIFTDEVQDTNDDTDSAQGGLLSGMYTRIFTPAKPRKSSRVPYNADDNGAPSQSSKPSIVGMFDVSVTEQMELFSPSKRMKHVHPNRDAMASKSFVCTVADDGCIDIWTCNFDLKEEAFRGNRLSSANVCSSLDLSSDEQLQNAKVLRADIDIGAEASIVLCIRASVKGDNGPNTSRFYLVHHPIDLQTGDVGKGSSIWLNRYANSAISSNSNPLICSGLVTSTEELDGESSTVAYCVFHQERRNGYDSHLPVTVSAVQFAPNGTNTVLDIDLPTDIAPHLVAGAVQYDNTTDGCNAMCTTGCVTNIRAIFPTVEMGELANRAPSSVDKGMVDVLVSHIYSAFQTHERKKDSQFKAPMSPLLRIGNSPNFKRAESFLLPPSITHANAETLSEAIVAVSEQLVDESIASSIPAMNVIEDKLQMHQGFIKYLTQAGIYKRVNFRGRVALRDHGEMMYCIGGLLNSWNTILELETRDQSLHNALESDVDVHREELRLFSEIVRGLEKNITKFPENFLLFQEKLLSAFSENGIPSSNWVVFALLTVHCEAIECAINYRSEASETLYDISDKEGAMLYHRNGVGPWTSSQNASLTFEQSLKALQLITTGSSNSSQVFLQMKEKVGEFVECLTKHWLEGYSFVSPSARSEDKYDTAKSLSYVLLTAFCPPSPESDDDIAFTMSLAHAYFFGVTELCNQYANIGRYDENYDLIAIMSDPPPSLQNIVDSGSGLAFQKYVLRWHADRNMYGSVLLLGKYCHNILSEYMEEDERLDHLRWVQNVRSDKFAKASTGLLGLSSGIANVDGKIGDQSLESRKLVMSLAKLSALASKDDMESKKAETIANENLELFKAQDNLADILDDEDVRTRIMGANELMTIATTAAQSNVDTNDKFRACLAALSIAKAMKSDDSVNDSSRELDIAKIWAVSINIDVQIWLELLDQWDLLSDDDKVSRLENTVFYHIASQYYSDNEVGFALVQKEVVRLLAIDQVGFMDLLKTAVEFSGLSTQ